MSGITSPVSHAYTNCGSHTVKLTATNPAGIDEMSKEITFVAPTVSGLYLVSQNNLTVNIAWNLVGTPPTITRVDWEDGVVGGASDTNVSSTSLSHTYAQAGTYTIRVYSSNACGSDSKTTQVTVSIPVVVYFNNFNVGTETATCNASASWQKIGMHSYSVYIEWGDGQSSTPVTNVTTQNHTYGSSGTYLVKFRMNNASGEILDTKETTVSCGGSSFFSGFSLVASPGYCDAVLSFSKEVGHSNKVWIDWGDGTTAETNVPITHTYASGLWTVNCYLNASLGTLLFTQQILINCSTEQVCQCPDGEYSSWTSIGETISTTDDLASFTVPLKGLNNYTKWRVIRCCATDTGVTGSDWTVMAEGAYDGSGNPTGVESGNQVIVANMCGEVSESPLAPASINIYSLTDSSVHLVWPQGRGATHYTLEYKKDTDTTWISVTVSRSATTIQSYINTELTGSTTYNFRVKSINTKGESGWLTINVTTDVPSVSIPAVPTGLQAKSYGTSVMQLTWDPVPTATHYKIQYKPSTIETWSIPTPDRGTEAGVSLNFLVKKRIYDFRVLALNVAGESVWSEPIRQLMTWDGVTNFSVTTKTSNSLSVTWVSQTTGPQDIVNGIVVDTTVSYELQYKKDGEDTWTDANLAFQVFPPTIEGLEHGTRYDVRVRMKSTAFSTEYYSNWSMLSDTTANIDCYCVLGEYGTSQWEVIESKSTIGEEGTTLTLPQRTNPFWNEWRVIRCIATEEGQPVGPWEVVNEGSYGTEGNPTNTTGGVVSVPELITGVSKDTVVHAMKTSYVSDGLYNISWIASGDRPVSYTVDFGDASTPETVTDIKNIQHRYKQNGTYPITVTASNTVEGVPKTVTKSHTLNAMCYGPPTELSCSSKTSSSIALTWKPGIEVSGYKLEYKKSTDSSWTVFETSSLSHSLPGLSPDAMYLFRLAGVNTMSGHQSIWTILSEATYPSTPVLTQSETKPDGFKLMWTPLSSGGSQVLGYSYEAAGSVTTYINLAGTIGQYTISDLSYSNRKYFITLVTSGLYGLKDDPGAAFTAKTSVEKPIDFKINTKTNSTPLSSHMDLTWSRTYTDTPQGYVIEHKKTVDSLWSSSTTALVYETSLSGLNIATEYDVRIKAKGLYFDSEWVTVTLFTHLPTPTNLVFVPSNMTDGVLSCDTVSGATSYQFSLFKSGHASAFEVQTRSTPTITIGGLLKDTHYDFGVVAKNGNAESEMLLLKNRLTVPDTPTITSGQIDVDRIFFRVSSVFEGSSDIDFKKTSNTEWDCPGSSAAYGDETMVKDLDQGTSYDFRATAYRQGVYAIPSSPITISTLLSPPSIRLSGIGQTNMTASWNTVSGVIRYELQYKKDSESLWTNVTLTSQTVTTQTISGISPGVKYNVHVRSVTSTETSLWEEISGTTALEKPINITADTITDKSFRLKWTGSPGATGYEVVYRGGVDGWETRIIGNQTSLDLTALTVAESYDIGIRALTVDTVSEWTYSYDQIQTKLSTPSGLIFNIQDDKVSGSWSPIEQADSYEYRYKESTAEIWITRSTTETTFSLLSLFSARTYDFQVRSMKSSLSMVSDWNQTTFTTMMALIRVSSDYTKQSPTTLGFYFPMEEQYKGDYPGVQFYYKSKIEGGTETSVSGPVSSISDIVMSGLVPGKNYSVYAKAVWGSFTSDWYEGSGHTSLYQAHIYGSCTGLGVFNLSWETSFMANSYLVEYKKASDMAWTTYTSTTGLSVNVLLPTSPDPGPSYDFRVTASVDVYTAVSSVLTLETKLSKPAMIDVDLSDGGSYSYLNMSWPSVPHATFYAYRYKLAETGKWTEHETTNLSALASILKWDLSVTKTIYCEVRAKTDSGNYAMSDWLQAEPYSVD